MHASGRYDKYRCDSLEVKTIYDTYIQQIYIMLTDPGLVFCVKTNIYLCQLDRVYVMYSYYTATDVLKTLSDSMTSDVHTKTTASSVNK